jgi:hypothetical protein
MSSPLAGGYLFPDLSTAPFAMAVEASPVLVAEQIVACFRAVACLDQPTTKVFEAVTANVGLDPFHPLAAAGLRLAADIDRELAGQNRNAYHNSQHICEVLLCSLFLARQAGLSTPRQARIAFAALMHDFHHDGTTNGGQSFRLERLAVSASRPYLMQSGVKASEIDAIAAIVFATDLASGAPYARRCFEFFHRTGARPDDLEEATGDLAPLRLLAADRELTFEAVLLAEADLLPSVALSDDYSMLYQQRLVRENRHIGGGRAEKLAFLDRQVPGFLVAGFFEPNLARLRRSLSGEGA